MKKVFSLAALTLVFATSFAQSQKVTGTNANVPVTNLTAGALATPAKSAPVQNNAATLHEAQKSNEIAPAKNATKATETKKSSNNSAANKNATPATK